MNENLINLRSASSAMIRCPQLLRHPACMARGMDEWVEEIPYGLRVSDDCTRLVGNPVEIEIIIRALDMVVDDCSLSRVAEQLNQDGYRTRSGEAWSASTLFALLPRMIQVGPRVFSSGEWLTRRARLAK